MKLRSAVLVLAALLPAAGIAGASASPASPAASSSDGQAVSSHGPAPISFGQAADCGGFSRSAPAIAGLTPAPFPLTTQDFCGSCSLNPCKGVAVTTICGYRDGQTAHCDPPLGYNCSDGVTWQCQCWYGPLP